MQSINDRTCNFCCDCKRASLVKKWYARNYKWYCESPLSETVKPAVYDYVTGEIIQKEQPIKTTRILCKEARGNMQHCPFFSKYGTSNQTHTQDQEILHDPPKRK